MGFPFSRYSRTGRLEIDIPDEKDVVGAAVDSGLPRTTLRCLQPFHHDSGGADSGTPHRRQRLAATALSPCAWSSARVTGVTAASYGVSPGHSRGQPEWDALGRMATPVDRRGDWASVLAQPKPLFARDVERLLSSGHQSQASIGTRTEPGHSKCDGPPGCSRSARQQWWAVKDSRRSSTCVHWNAHRVTAAVLTARMVERRPGNRPRA
jgi:hypothetical protein